MGDSVLVRDLQRFTAEHHEYTDPMVALFEVLTGFTPEKSGGLNNK